MPTTASCATGFVAGPQAISDGGLMGLKQVRQYRLDAGSFHQVGGPTAFAPLPTDIDTVDLRNTTLEVAFPECSNDCANAVVMLANGSGYDTTPMAQGDSVVWRKFDYTLTTVAAPKVTKGDGADAALAIITRHGADGTTVTSAVVVVLVGLPIAVPLASTGRDGVVEVVSAKGAGTIAEITVRTSTGTEIRKYRQDSNTGEWKLTT